MADLIIKTLIGMGIAMFIAYCGLAGILLAQIF